ncbi:rRNA pseudouridine synthase [Thermosulfurimonas sp. F29]|nr:rRNA pseudouridine synthase [Thermosulfurimonas sp. F29]
MMRLDRFLAEAGLGSRREVKKLILKGRVTVNGRRVRDPAYRVRPGEEVTLDGEPVPTPQGPRYFLLYKPRGYVTSTRDPHPTVMEFFRDVPRAERLFPVGRLDRDAEGLLLVTDDGELAHRLLHPRYRVPRVYRVRVRGEFPEEKLRAFEEGFVLDGRRTLPARARILERGEEDTLLEITLFEGRHHQIKRMFRALGFEVIGLKRVRFGPLELGHLRPGEFRKLSPEEIQRLKLTTASARRPR